MDEKYHTIHFNALAVNNLNSVGNVGACCFTNVFVFLIMTIKYGLKDLVLFRLRVWSSNLQQPTQLPESC